MPLIPCPECGRQISTAAEACPQCGHPNRSGSGRPGSELPAGPRCYQCKSTATTRCQSCGALSCAVHVNSIYVSHGRGGAYELRCESCFASAQAWRVFGWLMAAIVLAIVFFAFMSMQR